MKPSEAAPGPADADLVRARRMAETLGSTGFRVVDLLAEEIRRRYLAGKSEGLDILDAVRLCCAERQGARQRIFRIGI